jgi:hypothetical protein
MKFTICGSAKFESLWHEWNKKLGLMGHISYSLMTFPSIEGGKTWYTSEQKELLDLTHLAKIDASDAILVLNKDGYIGESTAREIRWARLRDKRIFYLEVVDDMCYTVEDIDDLMR